MRMSCRLRALEKQRLRRTRPDLVWACDNEANAYYSITDWFREIHVGSASPRLFRLFSYSSWHHPRLVLRGEASRCVTDSVLKKTVITNARSDNTHNPVLSFQRWTSPRNRNRNRNRNHKKEKEKEKEKEWETKLEMIESNTLVTRRILPLHVIKHIYLRQNRPIRPNNLSNDSDPPSFATTHLLLHSPRSQMLITATTTVDS